MKDAKEERKFAEMVNAILAVLEGVPESEQIGRLKGELQKFSPDLRTALAAMVTRCHRLGTKAVIPKRRLWKDPMVVAAAITGVCAIIAGYLMMPRDKPRDGKSTAPDSISHAVPQPATAAPTRKDSLATPPRRSVQPPAR